MEEHGMRRKRTRLLIPILMGTLLPATPVSAENFRSGSNLLSDCEASAAICNAYVVGAIDAWLAHQEIVGQKKSLCIPEKVQLRQLTDIVVKYLKDHAATRHWSAAVIVYNAAIAAYPCKPT